MPRSALVLLLALAAGAAPEPQTLRVAAAISLREAIVEIAEQYRAAGGPEIQPVFGGSGQLRTQIENGADVDLFIAAANEPVDALQEQGLLVNASRRVVAGNELVLIVPAGDEHAPASFRELTDPQVRRVAIGEPKTVPAGAYAAQVLDKLDLTERLRERLLYGANVRQVLDYVIRGEVNAGIVYKTDALSAGQKVRVIAAADAAWHSPIEYPGVVVAASGRRAAAERFLEFLSSDAAQTTFKKHGFASPPTSQPARDARPTATAPTSAPSTRPAAPPRSPP